jgi:hypothetical protein
VESTFTVTNTNDSGIGSLRQAILDANTTGEASIIRFDDSLTGQTIHLTGSHINITESVIIDGDINNNRLPDIAIDATGNSRVFDIDDGNGIPDQDITLNGLVITGGVVAGPDERWGWHSQHRNAIDYQQPDH